MRMNSFIKTTLLLFVLMLSAFALNAQTNYIDYQRADSLFRNNDRVYSATIQTTWIPDSHIFWYLNTTRIGKEYIMVDTENGTKNAAFDQEKLAGKISEANGKKVLAFKLPITRVNFSKDLKSLDFILDSVKWNYIISDNTLTKGD